MEKDCHNGEGLRENIRVGIVVLTPKEVLLIKRFKNNRHYWVFPGGHKRKNEKLAETAIRELKEETNLDAKKEDLEKILAYFSAYSLREEVFYLLKKNKPLPVKIIGEEKERNTVVNSYRLIWYPLGEIDKIKDTLYPEEVRNWLVSYHLSLKK